MNRTLFWLLGVLLIVGIVGYQFFREGNQKNSPLPPEPNSQFVDTPKVLTEDEKYQVLVQEAQAEQDKEREEKINEIEVANTAITHMNPEGCMDIQNASIKTLCLDSSNEALAVKEKNIAYCDPISDATKKSICVDKIYIVQAKEKKDPIICDMITATDLRALCVSDVEENVYDEMLNTASGKAETIDCTKFSSAATHDQCEFDKSLKNDYLLFSEAVKTENDTICDRINDKKLQSDCGDGVLYAHAKKSLSLKDCNNIKDEKMRTQCSTTITSQSDSKYFQNAIQTKSKTTCEKISSDKMRTNCFDKILLSEIVISREFNDCYKLSDTSLQQVCKNSIGTN